MGPVSESPTNSKIIAGEDVDTANSSRTTLQLHLPHPTSADTLAVAPRARV